MCPARLPVNVDDHRQGRGEGREEGRGGGSENEGKLSSHTQILVTFPSSVGLKISFRSPFLFHLFSQLLFLVCIFLSQKPSKPRQGQRSLMFPSTSPSSRSRQVFPGPRCFGLTVGMLSHSLIKQRERPGRSCVTAKRYK